MIVCEMGGGNYPVYSKKLGTGLNLDVRAGENVDLIVNFEDPLPLPNNEYDMVYSHFVLEHISWRKIPQFLSEIHRVLKVGGKALIVTANLLEQAKVLVNKNQWDLNDLCMVFGDQDYPENIHKSSMSPELAVHLFQKAGFGFVHIVPVKGCITDMEIHACKGGADPRADWILNQIGDGEKILDVGCADGQLLRGHRRNIVFVDKDPQLLPNFIQADASMLDKVFLPKQFDVAVLAEILEHVDDPVAVLRSAWQVAKRLLITVPNEFEWPESLGPFKSKSHIRFYTVEMLTQHLLEAKLDGLQYFRVDKLSFGGWAWFITAIQTNR